jgi:hypothetical protein
MAGTAVGVAPTVLGGTRSLGGCALRLTGGAMRTNREGPCSTIVKNEGPKGLYAGLSASLLRQVREISPLPSPCRGGTHGGANSRASERQRPFSHVTWAAR